MTDTVTTEVVDQTITALGLTLQRATERLTTEEREFIAKRDAVVETAHRLGTRNGIGPSLDDLLEEFDLPRRPYRSTVRVLFMMTEPLDPTGDRITTAHGDVVYRAQHQRIMHPIGVSYEASQREGDTCLCDGVEHTAHEFMTTYFSRQRADGMTFQIGRTWCPSPDCPNTSFYPDGSEQGGEVDWTTVPVHKVEVPAT